MRGTTLVVCAASLCACVAAPRPVLLRPSVEARVGESPQVGVAAERSVGEVIYENYNYDIVRETSTRLAGPLVIDVFLAEADLGPDDKLVPTTDLGVSAHCAVEPVLHVAGDRFVVCLRDENSDGMFDSWRSPDGPPARRGWANLKQPAAFTEKTAVEMAERGFRYELLYQGLSSGVANILYREYLDSLVRPAFQQDLTYTLNPAGETAISFRGLRMTVQSADNNSIRYTIDRGLQPGS